ncbi:MAG: FAD-dependent oxidoreductase [candidate division NC10 bacterium]|nr:FAD-dependent oxidoreductase [candidate division NC10 bacterium]
MSGLKIYGTGWCPDCRVVGKLLGEHRIPYTWIDVETDPRGLAFIEQVAGKQAVPVVAREDGTVLVQPSRDELARRLNLPAKARCRFADLVILGGGPAGLTAAIYAAREGIETVVLEKQAVGGQAAITESIENFPGFPDAVGGLELAGRLERQAKRFGVTLHFGAAQAIEGDGDYRIVRTDNGEEFCSWAVILATGSFYKRLGVPGEERFSGRGVHFCATCDGPFYEGEELAVVGGGNSAVEEGLFLTRFATKVTLLVRGGELKASRILVEKIRNHPKVQVRYRTAVEEFRGDGKFQGIRVRHLDTGAAEELAPGGVFVFIGMEPNTQFLKGAIDLDQWGFVLTGPSLESSLKGVFACGDVRAGSTKQVASAAGEGATAALMVREYLKGLV